MSKLWWCSAETTVWGIWWYQSLTVKGSPPIKRALTEPVNETRGDYGNYCWIKGAGF
jgi:hypothetical protein